MVMVLVHGVIFHSIQGSVHDMTVQYSLTSFYNQMCWYIIHWYIFCQFLVQLSTGKEGKGGGSAAATRERAVARMAWLPRTRGGGARRRARAAWPASF